MKLEQFLNLDETHTLSSEEVQALNYNLSIVKLKNIPIKHRSRVLDYIVNALNFHAVSPDIVATLDELRLSLEDNINV